MKNNDFVKKINLNTNWQFQRLGDQHWLQADVPGCVHTDLFNNRKIPDPFYGCNELELRWIEFADWQYRLEFEVTEEILCQRQIELVFDGLDTIATIILNKKEIAETNNMFVCWRFNVKKYLKPGSNRLEIIFHNPMDAIKKRKPVITKPLCGDFAGGRNQLRKQQCSFGWDWGPRFPSSGIWRGVRLEAWSVNRISDYHIVQQHSPDSALVSVKLEPFADAVDAVAEAILEYKGSEVVACTGKPGKPLELLIDSPKLWWPNNLGVQELYTLTVNLLAGGKIVDRIKRRIGLCEIKLDQHKDEWGKSFQFKVNGRQFFAKGANWIPAHIFVNKGDELIPALLDSCVDANMNILRVWGGGIYESDAFYEQCLERGLMVWQDFMFTCSLYPADNEFLNQVRSEAEYQVRRLRNYSNLALWCGNNEIIQGLIDSLRSDKKLLRDYEKIFHEILPETLSALNPEVAYWPSSENNPDDPYGNSQNEDSGDAHYWGVWHKRAPISDYEKQNHRFFSEFGMQAFPHIETARTFTESSNIFGPEMNNHQKNAGGNQVIFHYIAELYRFPKDYLAIVYLSQIMQAECIRVGVEHMRRNMPRTMGAIYWQLNDCWPVASWSSIDFGGRWKALHYAAKRFFAPALVSARLIGKEYTHNSTNTIISDVSGAVIYTVFDGISETGAELLWELWSISMNKALKNGRKTLILRPNESSIARKLDFTKEIAEYGHNDLILRTKLISGAYPDSCNTTFFTPPKNINFTLPLIKSRVIESRENRSFTVELTASCIAHRVYVNLKNAVRHSINDNFFDLFPGETKKVTIHLWNDIIPLEFEKTLTVYSYRDSYLD